MRLFGRLDDWIVGSLFQPAVDRVGTPGAP